MLIPAVLTTMALILIIYVLNYVNSDIRTSDYSAIIFTSFAASAFILFMIPHSSASNIRRFVISYILAGIFGEIGYLLVPYLGFYLAIAIVLFSMALLLFETGNIHPPAMGIALAFVIFRVSYPGLLVLFIGIVMLSMIKLIVEKYGLALRSHDMKDFDKDLAYK